MILYSESGGGGGREGGGVGVRGDLWKLQVSAAHLSMLMWCIRRGGSGRCVAGRY